MKGLGEDEQMSKYNFKCVLCRDKGREEGCPSCGEVTKITSHIKFRDVTLVEMGRMHIPQHYIGNVWDSLILKEDYREYCNEIDFTNYTNQLDKVYKHLVNGGTIPNSAVITSPMGYGKTTWAYNCIIELLKNGFKVPPIISTSQLKTMQTKAYERPTWHNKWNDYSYSEYVEADVLFITVTKGPEYVYATRLLIDIVDTRSRISKPTVILSDWSIGSLINTDKTGMLLTMLRGGTNVDPYKYMTNIQFSPNNAVRENTRSD